MKFRKLARTKLMLMGLGATLLLAGSAYAQQDMDPTDFPVNPGTPKVERHIAQRTARNVEQVNGVEVAAFLPGALGKDQNTQQESDFERMVVVDGTMVMILMAGITAIVLYAMAATKRERRLQPMLPDGPYSPVSGATTH
jgi:hypothetical protein